MIVDGITLFDDVGFLVEERGRSLSVGGVRLAQGQSPFAFKRFITGRQATSALPITASGVVTVDNGLTVAAGLTQLQTRMDRLKWRLRQQTPHTVRWTDQEPPLRFWDVEFTDLIVRGFAIDWLTPAKRVEIITLAADPRAKDDTETTLDGAPSPPTSVPIVLDIIPIGDAPQGGLVTIEGNTATPLLSGWSLEYRDEADVVLFSLTWDGQDLESTDIVTIDLESGVVELDPGTGTPANAIDDLAAGSDLPISVDANDGADDAFLDQIAAKVPDLRLTGTGDVDAFTYVYRARYW